LTVLLVSAMFAGCATHVVELPLQRLVDTPLRDTSVCVGPDGTYYLTGTVARVEVAGPEALGRDGQGLELR
jgi:hypothetical protein